MFSLLIKKEYRVKFRFTNFLYNDLWSECERYFEQIDTSEEKLDDSTNVVNAMVASYNIVLYCGKNLINADDKIHLESFIRNQMKTIAVFSPMVKDVLDFNKADSVINCLFKSTEDYLSDLKTPEYVNEFNALKTRSFELIAKH
jgi:hypothetical protein